ncbi:MAG TPA: DUF5691 domain-containing protein [Pirellulales bacterium]
MDDLVKIALVGTSRNSAPIAAGEHPTGALVSATAADDRETLLLLHAGAQAIYGLAGRRPIAGVAALVPAEAETARMASRKLAGLLANGVATNATDLLVDFLRQMRGNQIVVPPDLLPLLLNCADVAVREQLLPVLGERGKWLSRQNPAWSWVDRGIAHLTDTDQIELKRAWDEGTIAERRQVLASLRRSDPRRAREWLEPTFAQEKPAHRVSLLEELAVGLSAADEPFLDGCLADRAPSVQQAAARLLCCLPDSSLSARMRARADAVLSLETNGASRKKAKLTCAPPEKIDREADRDGIPSKAPAGRGLKALWVETIIGAVPPSHWANKFALAPAVLIEAVYDDPFEQAVLVGWSEAALRFGGADGESTAWLTPLWNHWAGAAKRMKGSGRAQALERLKSLLPSMPSDDAEQGMLALFTAAAGSDHVESLSLLPLLPRPWSAAFGERFLELVRRVLGRETDNTAYQWSNALFTAGRAIPAEVFTAAQAEWQLASPKRSSAWHVDAVGREVERFLETIQTRQSFFAEVAASMSTERS